MPTGINWQMTDRQKLLETAHISMRRLRSLKDMAGVVSYLLSKSSTFVSGQVLAMSGGQL